MTAAGTEMPATEEDADAAGHGDPPDGSLGNTRLIPPRPTTRAGRRLDHITASGGGRIDRFNRGLFLAVGVILAAAGGGGLVLGEGVVAGTSPATLYARRADEAASRPDLAAGIAMAVCLVLLLVGLRWAFAQLRPVSDGERLANLTLFAGPRGRTTVAATTVAKAAAADISSRPGVTSAKVRLRALRPQTRVTLSVEMILDADPNAVLGELQDALTRLFGALDADRTNSQAEIRLRFARPRPLRSDRPARVT
ncbi:MAG: alkaline shock response membrane anchor protein AmaP [Actinomycetota bacterium]|nr:alkaline shock response membrane anchor protein AmaP [Actinomycetota bacterium]